MNIPANFWPSKRVRVLLGLALLGVIVNAWNLLLQPRQIEIAWVRIDPPAQSPMQKQVESVP